MKARIIIFLLALASVLAFSENTRVLLHTKIR